MNRKEAREFAMQVVFHMEIHKDFAPEALIKFPKYEEMANQKDYVKTVIEKLCEKLAGRNDIVYTDNAGCMKGFLNK